MIFNRQLLYLHVPKTGGMALTDLLLRAAEPPVYYLHPDSDPRWPGEGVVEIHGSRHETLREAASIVADHGMSISDFPVILAVVRNPYEIEVSRYGYYRKGHPWDALHRGRDLALAGDFSGYVTTAEPHGGPKRSIEQYLLLDGEAPSNLRVLHHERLAEELPPALRDAGIDVDLAALPELNVSEHGPWRDYYRSAAEESAVYNRYRYLFDNGWYGRLALGDGATDPARAARGG